MKSHIYYDMRLLYCFQDVISRVLERKRTFIVLISLYLASMLCGIIFIKSSALYEYHLQGVEEYFADVCYGEGSIFWLFCRRFAVKSLFLALFTLFGVHFLAVGFGGVLIVFRGYSLGGCVLLFLSVYRLSGALVLFVLYLPVCLLCDAAYLSFSTLAFQRARSFCFCKEDWRKMLFDFLCGVTVVGCVCLFEAFLLLVLF